MEANNKSIQFKNDRLSAINTMKGIIVSRPILLDGTGILNAGDNDSEYSDLSNWPHITTQFTSHTNTLFQNALILIQEMEQKHLIALQNVSKNVFYETNDILLHKNSSNSTMYENKTNDETRKEIYTRRFDAYESTNQAEKGVMDILSIIGSRI